MELWASKKAFDALPEDLQAIVTTAAESFNTDYMDAVTMQEREMFNKSFKRVGNHLQRIQQRGCSKDNPRVLPALSGQDRC